MIRAMEQKDYVDRGVQTDLPRRLSRPTESSTSKPVNRVFPAPSTPPTISRCSSYSPRDIAHNHSPASGDHPMPAHAAGPTRSSFTSRKHAQLPYSRPSHVTIQRILSLPETCPPFVTQVPRETRGASLSERPRVSLSFSDNTAESSASAETSFLSSDHRSGSPRTRRSLPSSDMPHTPSPPSSPESVMIIGNDMQVPVSFLRQKVKSSRVYDDGGWISWASSPPKPIPALHGPLSLPYARCPSGAEGTIVEGEDLSRMIWGLGIEETGNQPAHSRANSAHVSHKSTPQSSFPPRLQAQVQRNSQYIPASHPHHNASPRNQLQTLQDRHHPPHVDGIAAVNEARNQIFLHQRALESLSPRHSSIQKRLYMPQNSDSWTDVYAAHDDFVDQLGAYEGKRGLGLDWQETLRHQREANEDIRTKTANSLKPSAPVFVPARQQVTQQYPRIFVEPRMPHTINPPQRLTAIEIAQQYRAQRGPQSSLPTPPGSLSPQWTPFMPHYTDPFPPLDIHNLLPVNQQPNFPSQPVLRELQECPLDPSQELRKFVYDQMRNRDREYTSIDSGIMHQTPPLTPHVLSSPSQYRNPTIDMSPSHPGPPPNSPLPPIPSAHTNRVRNFLAAPPSPTSPDTRVQSRNLTRQPRSVPFARMLQRRLSSVPEEESGQYMEPHSPPPSPPKTAAATSRPPRPPSHSLADSFQSRSHPGPPSQWHTRPTSPGRGGFAPQTRMAPELESDEAKWRMPRSSGAMATVKLPLKTTNSDMADSRGEGSSKDGNSSENAWEKENGKGRRKVRSKKTKLGHFGHVVEDNVSPWLAASQAAEAWL
ncbi:hypothetical protein K438DRAFT_1809829 [Mycena galopus ATCC 62051]|nr:hypothetical protein K438DRAFT_1809829 [Mycena galopus ATCC 62051]